MTEMTAAGLRGLSLMLLPLVLSSGNASLLVFIVFYGLDWIATVPPTVALATQRFGRERGTVSYGWVFASNQVGAAVAATGAGVIRTVTGDYFLAFGTAGLLCLVASAFSLGIGRSVPARRRRSCRRRRWCGSGATRRTARRAGLVVVCAGVGLDQPGSRCRRRSRRNSGSGV
jgi:hypothetical protein